MELVPMPPINKETDAANRICLLGEYMAAAGSSWLAGLLLKITTPMLIKNKIAASKPTYNSFLVSFH
jgi:hypothetical protein